MAHGQQPTIIHSFCKGTNFFLKKIAKKFGGYKNSIYFCSVLLN